MVEHGASQAAHTESLSDDMHADQILLAWDGRKMRGLCDRVSGIPFERASGSCINPNLFRTPLKYEPESCPGRFKGLLTNQAKSMARIRASNELWMHERHRETAARGRFDFVRPAEAEPAGAYGRSPEMKTSCPLCNRPGTLTLELRVFY